MMNRGFLYGDGFFESIRVISGTAPLLSFHLQRILEAVSILKLESEVELNETFLQKIIDRAEHADCRLRINFFRDAAGSYLPDSNKLGFNVSTTAVEAPFYLPQKLDLKEELSSAPVIKGKVGLFPDPKPLHPLFTIKCLSSAYYVLAALYKKENNLDCLLISDENGYLLEELSCNFLLKINGTLVIPPAGCGMVKGAAMRFIQSNYGFQLLQRKIAMEDVWNAEGIYLTQGITGMRRFIISK